jgi:sensor histidine kinase YesM
MFKKIAISFFIGTLVFLIGTFFFKDFEFKTANELLEVFLFYQLYAFVLSFSNMQFFDFMAKRKWTKQQRFFRITLGILGSVIITLIGLFFLRLFTAVIYGNQTLINFLDNESFRNYQFGLWVTLTVVIIFHVVYFINLFQKQRLKEQKVIAKTANAQLDALKSQLDPHFLFNSLNVLSSLIHENPDKAEQFTTKLSKVYRYVLEQKTKELVPLQEELQFAKIYMDLLKMRFEDSLNFHLHTETINPEYKIVPLALQLLLENAVKHNTVNSKNPLTIKIYEENQQLIIENNLQAKRILSVSSGFGLNNIKQRYQLLTKEAVLISKNEQIFKVQLPLLTQNNLQMDQVHMHHSSRTYQQASRSVKRFLF